MSASVLEKNQSLIKEPIKPNSLLDTLYTYYPLEQLEEMLDTNPDHETLVLWKVSVKDYKSAIRTAIEYVKLD